VFGNFVITLIMKRKSSNLKRWWCLLYTRPTR